MRPLVSIIVPTHNRAHYVVPTINALFKIPDVEIVVTDTSSKDDISVELTTEILESKRFRLVRSTQPLNVVENFELGLQAATGEYLVFIGDDDFVHPSIGLVAEWAKSSLVDALTTTMTAHYYWPDFVHKRMGSHFSGTLTSRSFTGKMEYFDAKEQLAIVANNPGAGVLGMPRAYAGLVSRKLIDHIVAKYGALFGGVSPDIYSSALISFEAKRAAKFDFPFIIPGSSGKSTAGQSANGNHVGALRANAHIGAFKALNWNKLVPEFYAIQTVWSYSLIEALKQCKFPQKSINFPRLYIKCLINHPRYWSTILDCVKCYSQIEGRWTTVGRLILQIYPESVWAFVKIATLVRAKLGIKDKNIYFTDDLDDTNVAMTKTIELFHFDRSWLP
jgi:glycosyltransferase involved in cell wall biosynthesis